MPQVVLCGSFRRDPEALRREYAALKSVGCRVLSPRDVDFVASLGNFVLASHELEREPAEIEQEHLEAIRAADFVWLHAPSGYVGVSGAMEIGFARSVGIPVFGSVPPSDMTIRAQTTTVESPEVVVDSLEVTPSSAPSLGLVPLQGYYRGKAVERGWGQETANECLRFLREEVNELARELRPSSEPTTVRGAALELADVQLYVLHMANILGIDLSRAVADKERINAERFRARSGAASSGS